MTFSIICVFVYILSCLIVGSLHWASYQDGKKTQQVSMEDKVMNLYIVPFCPIVNTFIAVMILLHYLDAL